MHAADGGEFGDDAVVAPLEGSVVRRTSQGATEQGQSKPAPTNCGLAHDDLVQPQQQVVSFRGFGTERVVFKRGAGPVSVCTQLLTLRLRIRNTLAIEVDRVEESPIVKRLGWSGVSTAALYGLYRLALWMEGHA